MSGTRYTQFCALARAAEIIGERWTLLIVRELLLGPKRFVDLTERLAGVSPTMLTARLNGLIKIDLIRRTTLPPFSAPAYELTPTGLALKPAIRELILWGGHFLFPMRPDDAFEPDWGLLALDAIARRKPTPARRIVLHIRHGAKAASYLVEGSKSGTSIVRGDGPATASISARFDTLLQIIAGVLPLDRAMAAKLATVGGSVKIARTLPQLFDVAASRKAQERA
jgi:DNA-binding HxlR family transcriptional regulator